MNRKRTISITLFSAVLLLPGPLCHAVDRYVSLTGGHVSPFTSWPDAATNIQAAIDAASAGDVIWVTNGIYSSGGKVMAGDLTNRVALDKALTVRSVNGPTTTTIQGQWDPVAVTGPAAVRCAWLTNGTILSGFTIQGGATRTNGDSTIQNGGGVWGLSTNAIVTNCVIMGNTAKSSGGGAYSGTLKNCTIKENSATSGGGASQSTLFNCYVVRNSALFGGGLSGPNAWNCAIVRNSAAGSGGGVSGLSFQHRFANCTVAENSASGGSAGLDGIQYVIRNCIIWNNRASSSINNYSALGNTLSYCCTFPLPSGTGNISADPQLLSDGIHLAATSPCRGAGNSLYAAIADVDGQTWTNPPSIGCDEWYPDPFIIVQPKPKPATGTGQVRMTAAAAGQEPFYFFWTKDGLPLEDDAHYGGTDSASVLISNFGLGDAGSYQVVASNAVGMATSTVAQVNIHCVDALSAPASPYTNWATAAATIQGAIEVAGLTDVVLVTNGVYASGGKVKAAGLTNRVVLDKPILVTSVNGPNATIIQGQWDPATTNGPAAVRCAWLTDDAGLSGFTLRDGATTSGDSFGGGVQGTSTNAVLANCVITNCQAGFSGGGAIKCLLSDCLLIGNFASSSGGGAYGSYLVNCRVTRNRVGNYGGGVSDGRIRNCILTENYAGSAGGGGDNLSSVVNCTVTRNSAGIAYGGLSLGAPLTNCIVYLNQAPAIPNFDPNNRAGYTCSTPIPIGLGNISDDPQLVDSYHLAVTSPCRGMGSSLYVAGTDLDGEPWASPPSMGCDEVWGAAPTGPLSVNLTAAYPEVAAYGYLPLTGEISGSASRLEWSFGDGPTYTNLSYFTLHQWTNAGDYNVTFTAFNADNPAGVSTNLLVHVVPLESPELSVGGLSNTTFRLSFPGQAGVTYVVEQATNLAPPVVWKTVQTLSSTGAWMQVTDSKATNAMRFYRARTQ